MFFSFQSAVFCMVALVGLTNYLVLFPINDWLTWGAFPYPLSFLITELTNRFYGAKRARQVVYFGFVFGAILSVQLATPKIAFGSVTAFFVAQMLDIFIFSRLRKNTWWVAPLSASILASFVDTSLFWTLAFWGENLPVLTWATGDFLVKLTVDFGLLVPFRMIVQRAAIKSAVVNAELV